MDNPDLIEEIFQGMYPGATTRGLKRVKTQTLKFCVIEKEHSSMDEWEKLANEVSKKKECSIQEKLENCHMSESA